MVNLNPAVGELAGERIRATFASDRGDRIQQEILLSDTPALNKGRGAFWSQAPGWLRLCCTRGGVEYVCHLVLAFCLSGLCQW